MKNTKFLRVAALLIAVIMMMSLCLVSCDDGENAETTPAETTPSATTPAETTPAETTSTSPDAPQNPTVDVTTAAGIAALLNANLADLIPTIPEDGEQGGEQGGIGNIGDIMGGIDLSAIDAKAAVAELIKSMEGMSLTVDNISGSLVADQSLPEKFQLSNNFLYMIGKDASGNEAKVIGKLSADGIGVIGSNAGMVMPMTPFSFAELYAQIDEALAGLSASLESMPKVEIDIDLDAIKEALTIKEDDLVDMGNGVWQLKATYVVDAIKTVLTELGMTDAELTEAKDLFDLVLMTSMSADLSKYAQTGELTLKLEIPQVFTFTVYSSATTYTVDVVAGEVKASFRAEQTTSGVNFTAKITEGELTLLDASFNASATENGMTATFVANVLEISYATDENGNITNAVTTPYKAEGTFSILNTGASQSLTVSCDGKSILEMSFTATASAEGMQMTFTFADKQNALNASITASMGASTELHVLVNDAGVETKADFVMNMADANGEIVKMSVTASGVTTFSFDVKVASVDASGTPKFNVALVTPDGDISFDISTAAVAAPELNDAEKAALALCDNYLANYTTYMAQLADYDAKVEAAVAAGKTLPMDFALVDKTNPNVVYHYYVFVYSAEEYEIDGFIELVPDTTGYNVITEADLAV
ncbi:MAG: hypothetical protein IKJ80_01820 [Clostridia bacterium]|nr:hypothetical protein [Clostridia bacterium]